MVENYSPVRAAEEYASLFFDKEKETDNWLLVRNAWLNGWDEHRILYPEM